MSLDLETDSDVVYRRIFSDFNVKEFIYYLSHENWTHVYQTENCDISFDIFMNILLYYFDLCFPLKEVKNIHQKTKYETFQELKVLKNRVALYGDLSRRYPEVKDVFTKTTVKC